MSAFKLYNLDENNVPVPVNKLDEDGETLDLLGQYKEWNNTKQLWKDTAKVLLDKQNVGEITISTVFLGMKHVGGMFETAIFGGPLDGEIERCQTYEGARLMHEKNVERVKYSVKDLKL